MIAAAALAAGCGDGPICQSEVMVIIQSPSGPVLVDSNLDADGVQTDVRIRSTVGEGEEVTVEVLDADGAILVTETGTTDADGDVRVEDLELPAGAAQLRAFVDAGECGSDEDIVDLDIEVGGDCVVAFRQEPLDIAFYAPLGVLNASSDTDAATDDFQGDLDVTTRGGSEVELFVLDGATGVETSVGTATADDAGAASFSVTLGQGRQTVRAVCSAGAGSSPSVSTSVFVDTVAPDCVMTAPVAGTTITPALDGNGDLDDGIQLTLGGNAAGGDVEGEEAFFIVTVDGSDTLLAGTVLGAGGDSSAPAAIDPATVPASAQVRFDAQDHAANSCTVTETYDVVYDGCSIAVTSPTTTVTSDADADGSNGAQIDVVLDVDPACAGRTVTSDCGANDPTGTVAGDGSLTLRVDMCGAVPCDAQDSCTFTVSNTAGIETSAGALLDFDDQPPPVGLQLVDPALICPAQLTPADDIAAGTPGVQIRVRVISPLAVDRRLEQTDGSGTQSIDASGPGGEVVVTLAAGETTFVGIATDDVGNTASSASCQVVLSDIAVGFSPPAADGAVGIGDGTVAGDELTFELCGTVSDPAAAVAVTVDGGPALAAAVVGTTWCVDVTLAESPPSYTVVATATNGLLFGQASLALTVDLSVPDTVTDLAVVADSRQSLEATWTAPADVAIYRLKYATTELTDGNFDVTGTTVSTGTPQAPGATETVRIAPLRTGTPYWVGLAAVDGGGNRGAAMIVGPITPLFDRTGAILPPVTDGDATSGLTLTRGKFNDDELWDVAVAAPVTTVDGASATGIVYVYFGSATGIADVPDVVIEGASASGNLGLAMTAVRWSSPSRHDLVISEPLADNQNGRVRIFNGGAGFVAGTYAPADADVTIRVHPTANYFTGGALGWSLAAPDFDGDGIDDLAVGSVVGGGGNGGVAIIYGGTVAGPTVSLSDLDASMMAGAVVHLLDDPDPTLFDLFGNYAFDLGPTESASDTTDDLLISFGEEANRVLVYRGTTVRPTTAGVHARAFTVGRDVRINYATADTLDEFGSAAGSISDQNGDGARDIVVSAHREGANLGVVLIIDGNTLGVGGQVTVSTPDATLLTRFSSSTSQVLGSAIVNNATSPGADVDGDGLEDLLFTERRDGVLRLLVWFGGTIGTGLVDATTAPHVIIGPSTFTGLTTGFGGTPHAALWAGDVNGDGLADICWGDGIGNSRDGSFEVLWDDGI